MKGILSDSSLYLRERVSLGSYPGGKSDKQKHRLLYEVTPHKITTMVEPFAGLVSYTIINSPKISHAIVNDIDPEVVAFLRCIKDKDLLFQLKEKVSQIYPVMKEEYYEWKDRKPTDKIELAIRRVVFQNCSFSGAGGGYSRDKATRKWHINRPKQWERVHQLFMKLDIEIFNENFSSFIDRIIERNSAGLLGNLPFVYLDPPYYKVAEGGDLYNYNSIDLNELIHALKLLDDSDIHWIMSNRDHPHVEKFFSEYYQLRYNTYNDMGNKQDSNPELIISNREFTVMDTKQQSLDDFQYF